MTKCCICKVKTETKQIGLKNICSASECFETLIKNAQKIGKSKLNAQQKKIAKEHRKQHAEQRERCRSLHTLCTQAQVAVNAFIRALDENHGYLCISCGKAPIEHAGHFIHAGTKWRTSRFRFLHMIIHGQCLQCNHFKGGDEVGYRKGLKARYGAWYLAAIDDLKRKAERGEIEKLTKEEVIEIKRWHRDAARKIKKDTAAGVRTSYERINNFWSTAEINNDICTN